ASGSTAGPALGPHPQAPGWPAPLGLSDLPPDPFPVARAGPVYARMDRPAAPAPPLPPGSSLNIAGLSSFVTPDDSFYRVDTALLVPQVNPAAWQLRIHGM